MMLFKHYILPQIDQVKPVLPKIPYPTDMLCKSHRSEMEENTIIAKSEEMEVTLRPLSVLDVDEFMAWAADDRVSKFCLWETYKSREQAVEWIRDHAIPHPWLRAICVGDRAVGTVSVTPHGGCRGEIGYVLAHEYWGRGIMTRVVGMAVEAVFREWGTWLRRVEAVVDVANTASQRVVEKAGFQREGVLRKYLVRKGMVVDVAMYSIVCDS